MLHNVLSRQLPVEPARVDDALRAAGIAPDRRPQTLAVGEWLDQGGPRGADLLWVTGRGTYDQFAAHHRPPAVQVIDFLDPMADGYAVADVVVSRAGMITVAELCAWGLPSVLVPLPTAAADHQTHNARVLAEAGASALIPQADLTAGTLAAAIESLLGDGARREDMAARARARGRPNAAADIVSKILTLAS